MLPSLQTSAGPQQMRNREVVHTARGSGCKRRLSRLRQHMCQLPPQQHSTPRTRSLSFWASRGPGGRAVCRDSRRAKDCTLIPARFRCSGEKEMTGRKRWMTLDLRGKLKARVSLSPGAGSAHSLLTSARSAQRAWRRHHAY